MLLPGLLSCSTTPSEVVRSEYLDLDSLLADEISWMVTQGVALQKEVVLGDTVQVAELEGDSAALSKELKIFMAINPAQPKYRNAFETRKQGSKEEYIKVDDTGELQSFTVEYDGSALDRVTGIVNEETAIYTAYREFAIDFDDGHIAAFSVTGYQKMILSDTVFFSAVTKVIDGGESQD